MKNNNEYNNEYTDRMEHVRRDYLDLISINNSYDKIYQAIIENPVTNIIYNMHKDYVEFETGREPRVYLINKTIFDIIDIMAGDEKSTEILNNIKAYEIYRTENENDIKEYDDRK